MPSIVSPIPVFSKPKLVQLHLIRVRKKRTFISLDNITSEYDTFFYPVV